MFISEMSDRPTYADAVRTRVTMRYADDEIAVTPVNSTEDTVNPLLCNRSGYLSLDWRAHKTPMMVSIF